MRKRWPRLEAGTSRRGEATGAWGGLGAVAGPPPRRGWGLCKVRMPPTDPRLGKNLCPGAWQGLRREQRRSELRSEAAPRGETAKPRAADLSGKPGGRRHSTGNPAGNMPHGRQRAQAGRK